MLARCALALAALLSLPVAGIPAQVQVGEPAGPLALNDQYDHPFQLSELRGSVAVLIEADRTGSEFNQVWGNALRSRYKGTGAQHVAIVSVANLSSVPGFMRGFVRKKFFSKDSAHPAGPVLLDWEGVLAAKLGFRADMSNVYGIDREGILRYKGRGKGTGADLDPLFRVIDGLLAQ